MSEPIPQRRWYYPTPDWLVLGLLALEGFVLVSERWFPLESTGWNVLIEVVGAMILLMPIWFLASLIFRWRFQFSIRSVMLMVVAVAIPCSWIAVKKEQLKQQMEVAAAIRELGWESYWSRPSPSWPYWIWELLGFEGRHIDSVRSYGRHGTSILCLKGLNQLTMLDIHETDINDAGLEHVKGLRQLRDLRLGYTKVTNEGLEHLARLNQLERLDLEGTEVTDAGLENLKWLHQLRILNLQSTKITDAGLEDLKGLSQLRILNLRGTQITDVGLEHLKGLHQLIFLSLHGTKVTDAGLETLKGLTNLLLLDLGETQVTDARLDFLEKPTPPEMAELADYR